MTETAIVVEQTRDWLDLLAIAFGCLGGLAGLVALIVAGRKSEGIAAER